MANMNTQNTSVNTNGLMAAEAAAVADLLQLRDAKVLFYYDEQYSWGGWGWTFNGLFWSLDRIVRKYGRETFLSAIKIAKKEIDDWEFANIYRDFIRWVQGLEAYPSKEEVKLLVNPREIHSGMEWTSALRV